MKKHRSDFGNVTVRTNGGRQRDTKPKPKHFARHQVQPDVKNNGILILKVGIK